MTNPQRLLISVLSLACFGLGIFAYSEHQARVAAESRLLEAQEAKARLAAAPTLSRADLPVPAQEIGPTPGEVSPLPSPDVLPPASVRGPAEGRPGPADFAGMVESPEVQRLMNLRARGALDGRYAGLFKELGLPPAQLEQLQQLLLDKQNTARDVIAAMRSQGLAPGRENAEQVRSLIESANAELDTQIRATIGETAFAQYQNYEQTQPQRALVERVQQRLSYSGAPLSDQQAASLVNLLAQNTPAPVTGARGFGNRAPGGSVAITDTVLAQAQSVLSSAQLTALQQLQQEQEAQAQLMRRSRRTLPTPSPTPAAGK